MSNIKTETFSGFIWAAIGSLGNGFITLLVTFILARTLCPSDFGVLEIILVVNTISTVLVDSGFSQALIRDKTATDRERSTVFYVNLCISSYIYILLFIFSPYFEEYFSIPDFRIYGRIAFLTIIIDSLSVIQNTIFTAKMNFRPISIATILSVVISGGTAIVLAHLNYGIWSLIVMLLLTSTLKSIILWCLSKWRPTLEFSRKSFIKYWKFGSFVFLQSLIDKVMINIESLIVGRYYTKSQLGYFSQSRKVDSYFGQALTSIVVKVTYPALIRVGSSNENLKNGYRKIIGLTTFFIAPFMMFLITFPNLTMGTLYGENWIDAGQYLRLWAVFGIVHPIQSICINIFYVKGESKLLFYLSTIKQIIKIAVLLLLATIGIYEMLQGIILSSVVMMFVFVFYSGRLINYTIKETFSDVAINIVTALISCTIAFAFSQLLKINSDLMFFEFGFCLALVFSLYFILSYCFYNKNLRELISLIKKK